MNTSGVVGVYLMRRSMYLATVIEAHLSGGQSKLVRVGIAPVSSLALTTEVSEREMAEPRRNLSWAMSRVVGVVGLMGTIVPIANLLCLVERAAAVPNHERQRASLASGVCPASIANSSISRLE